MIKVKEGSFYYRLLVEKDSNFKQGLIDFLGSNGLADNEMKKLLTLDLETDNVIKHKLSHSSFDLTIQTGVEIVLLFGCKLDSIEFAKLIELHFE